MLDPQYTFEITYKAIIDAFEYEHAHDNLDERLRSPKAIASMLEKIHYEMDERTQRNKLEPLLNIQFKQYAEPSKENVKFAEKFPPLIKALHPKLQEETYKILKNDISFLRKTTLVCFECCLEINKSKDKQICALYNEEDDLVGTGKLKPEILNQRFYVSTF